MVAWIFFRIGSLRGDANAVHSVGTDIVCTVLIRPSRGRRWAFCIACRRKDYTLSMEVSSIEIPLMRAF